MVHLTIDSILDSVNYGTKFGPHPSLSPKMKQRKCEESEMKMLTKKDTIHLSSFPLNGKK